MTARMGAKRAARIARSLAMLPPDAPGFSPEPEYASVPVTNVGVFPEHPYAGGFGSHLDFADFDGGFSVRQRP